MYDELRNFYIGNQDIQKEFEKFNKKNYLRNYLKKNYRINFLELFIIFLLNLFNSLLFLKFKSFNLIFLKFQDLSNSDLLVTCDIICMYLKYLSGLFF